VNPCYAERGFEPSLRYPL